MIKNNKLICGIYVPLIIIFTFLLFLPNCGGARVKARKDRVVQTSGGGRPDWALKEPRFTKKKTIFVSGQSSIRGDKALTQGFLAAELDARARLASEIGVKLNQQLQTAMEGYELDNQTIRSLTSLTLDRKLVSGLYIKERFYEKVAYTTPEMPDVEQTRYDCYVLAAISEKDLKNQVTRVWNEYEEVHRDKNNVPPELRKRFDEAWDKNFRPGKL